MHVVIGRASLLAGLLRSKPDHPDGAQRFAGTGNDPRGGGHDGKACRIIDRARAEVPAIEMAPDQHDPGAWIAPWNFGDDIADGRSPGESWGEDQLQLDGLAVTEDAFELFCVRHRQRRRRDWRL